MTAVAPRIVILGGGASGLLTARALLADGRPVAVTIVEPREALGEGVAFGTQVAAHRLNVPVVRMSALPMVPDDLHRWFQKRHASAGLYDFVERRMYAEYLRETLRDALERVEPNVTFRRVAGRAIDVAPGDPCRVVVADGPTLDADAVVLALGNRPPAVPHDAGAIEASPRYVADPWKTDALLRVGSHDTVAMLGTGLTAIDVVLALRAAGHQASILAISRRGRLPTAHRDDASIASNGIGVDRTKVAGSVLAIFRALRRDAESRLSTGGDGREAVAELRPHAQELWATLSLRERQRFVVHLRPYWDVLRHRMPPDVGRTVAVLRDAGALTVRAGRVRALHDAGDTIEFTLAPRGASDAVRTRAAFLVNATGPSSDYRGSLEALPEALRARGLLVPNELGLGVATERDGALVVRDSRASGRLFTLGPSRIGDLFETTAIPEIRVQAVALARRLLDPRD